MASASIAGERRSGSGVLTELGMDAAVEAIGYLEWCCSVGLVAVYAQVRLLMCRRYVFYGTGSTVGTGSVAMDAKQRMHYLSCEVQYSRQVYMYRMYSLCLDGVRIDATVEAMGYPEWCYDVRLVVVHSQVTLRRYRWYGFGRHGSSCRYGCRRYRRHAINVLLCHIV